MFIWVETCPVKWETLAINKPGFLNLSIFFLEVAPVTSIEVTVVTWIEVNHRFEGKQVKSGPSGDRDHLQSKIGTTVKGHTNDAKSFSNFVYLMLTLLSTSGDISMVI